MGTGEGDGRGGRSRWGLWWGQLPGSPHSSHTNRAPDFFARLDVINFKSSCSSGVQNQRQNSQ